MAVALRVRDETASGKEVSEFVIPAIDERCTVRDLIRTRVREEVARHNAAPKQLFRGLVQPTDAEARLNGYQLRVARQLDWEAQALVAERSFTRNGFFVLVDGRQAESLDDTVESALLDRAWAEGAPAVATVVRWLGGLGWARMQAAKVATRRSRSC